MQLPLSKQEHKVYVQHKIEQQSQLIWEWLKNKHAFFFIAG